MKKVKLTLAMIGICSCAIAQIVPPAQTPAAAPTNASARSGGGDFKPSGGDKTFELNFSPFSASPIGLNYLRVRMFQNDKFALRTGATLGLRAGSGYSAIEFGLFPGVEFHMDGTDRLSPYYALELAVAGKFISTEGGGGSLGPNDRGFFNIGANALLGCDFYFSKRIYIGTEAGFGLGVNVESDVTSGGTVTDEGGSEFRMGPIFNSAIRLGFVF